MKLGLSLSGINQTIKNLEGAGFVLQTNFKSELINQGKSLKNKAKEILERESSLRTNKRFWTGKLQDSIEMNILHEKGDIIGISVGPDMRKVPYAEWVEIGHYVYGGFYSTKGDWWEGYHYMEQTYAEVEPNIAKQIADTLKVKLNSYARTASKRTQHKKTGRFVAGFGGWN